LVWTFHQNTDRLFSLGQEFLYHIIVIGTKISMLLLYLRIFSNSGNRTFRRTCWAVITFCTVYYFATVIEDLFQTAPLSYFWLVRFSDS
jgi:hypothetical protein